MVKIIEMFIPKSNTRTRPGRKMTPRSITDHETDNTNVRANARAHALLQYNGNSRQASWHFSVDDEPEIYQSIPVNEVAFHAGDSTGNNSSVGVERCVNKDGDYLKTLAHAVELYRMLIKTYPTIIEVVQHNKWSGKHCPRKMREGYKGVNWDKFIARVKSEVDVAKPIKPVKPDYVTTNNNFKIGDTVKVKKTAKTFATGQSIAAFVKGSTYKVLQRGSNRLLLSDISSWVKTSDVEVVKSSSNKPTTGTSKPPKENNKANLTVDGKWGKDVTRWLQRYFETPVDGKLSGQLKNVVTNALYGNTASFGSGGSVVIKALQRYLNTKGFNLTVDGLLGPATIEALQSYLGTPVDGRLSKVSPMVKALQRRLNAGTF